MAVAPSLAAGTAPAGLTGLPAPGGPVRFQAPELPPVEAVLAYFRRSEEAGYYSNGGPCARLLAHRLGDHLGGTHAVLVSSATQGLLLALRAVLGAPADRRLVVTPSFTFTATACAIRWAGFEPLFVDVDDDSWQMSPAALRAALERRAGEVAGVLGCSSFGTVPPPATRAAWREACTAAGVPLLLDSAAAFDAVGPDGGRAGTQAEVEVFSFHATKPFAIGEGGLVTTPDPEVAARLARLANFGLDPATQASAEAGLNAKLSEWHAATGLAMLERYPEILARRRATAAALRERLAGRPVAFQRGSEGSTWQFFQLAVRTAAQRGAALAAAADLGVQVRTCFDPPLHRHPAFAAAPVAGSLAVTEGLAARALSLPLANTVPRPALERIAEVVERSCR